MALGDVGKEKPDWYMGYELQKVESVERSPDFDQKKMDRSKAQEEKKKAKSKQKRQLAKEGLDDAAPEVKKKPKRKADLLKAGQRIAVKWASKGGKNFMLTAGKSGPSEFYSGKVTSYNPQTRRYKVVFDDQKQKRYDVNLNDPKSSDYIPPSNWKKV
eukprot:COSAG03_NODE_119_length_12315_cov_126.503847_11_plen_158_part_00